MGKKSRSGMNILYRIIFPKAYKQFLLSGSGFWVRNLFDPGSGMEKFGSGIKSPIRNTAL
jgi:hypothetical protein